MRQALQVPVVHMDRQTDTRTDKGTVESTDGQTDIQTYIHNDTHMRVRAMTHIKNETDAAAPIIHIDRQTDARTDKGTVESTDG